MGVNGRAYQWFLSYLSDRKQYINYLNQNSSLLTLSMSIPQGSIMGPILFNVYINDIYKCLKYSNVTLFADDTCIYHSDYEINTLMNIVSCDLQRAQKWLHINRLTLNLTKSHYLIFSKKKLNAGSIENTSLTINNTTLSRLNDTNFLGIQIDDKLTWSIHLSFLTKKLKKYRAIIYLIRNNLTINSMKLIYNSLVYSNLLYCNVI